MGATRARVTLGGLPDVSPPLRFTTAPFTTISHPVVVNGAVVNGSGGEWQWW